MGGKQGGREAGWEGSRVGGKQDVGRTSPLFNVEMKSEVHHRLMSVYNDSHNILQVDLLGGEENTQD